MENIVNLEQLDYRDQLIKEYVDEHASGGGGKNMFCELEVDVDFTRTPRSKLYIKCYKNELLETDVLQFARNTTTPIHWIHSSGHWRCEKTRRGWIIPKPYNYVNLYKTYDSTKSSKSEIYDYWEILPKDRNGNEVTWEELINEFLTQRHNNMDSAYWKNPTDTAVFGAWNKNYACFINRWCGVAVIRNGKNITGYKRWMICGPENYGKECTYHHFYSKYAANGKFIIASEKSVDAYGLRI